MKTKNRIKRYIINISDEYNPIITPTTTTTTTTTTEKPWISYMDKGELAEDRLKWETYTGQYGGDYYFANPNSGWDDTFGYGMLILRWKGLIDNIINVTQVKVVVDFQYDMHQFDPDGDKIRLKITDNNYNALFDLNSQVGQLEDNEFSFTFEMNSDSYIWEILFDPVNDARLKDILFR